MQKHTGSSGATRIRQERACGCHVRQAVQACKAFIRPDLGQRQRSLSVLQAHMVLSQRCADITSDSTPILALQRFAFALVCMDRACTRVWSNFQIRQCVSYHSQRLLLHLLKPNVRSVLQAALTAVLKGTVCLVQGSCSSLGRAIRKWRTLCRRRVRDWA